MAILDMSTRQESQIHLWCICEYWERKFWQIAHDSPNLPIFPMPKFSRVQYIEYVVHDHHECHEDRM